MKNVLKTDGDRNSSAANRKDSITKIHKDAKYNSILGIKNVNQQKKIFVMNCYGDQKIRMK